ncbi:type II toxin-antitoxin system death-on-curing family toxin [Vibrio cincinnatiensis]|uniref:type II toxin-antitoxin system death-on-curing family toxin n=1 Tax=Vibrio cincinnatiensis TaxID=675 RepID=UPI001EDD6AF5|nr:type II toxin-antitoxin system death-on-curing family toxin [Vibrio cincinnatiensis]MCG3728983.1 type II toxin-antitoxin system death-on-curing family toxin [Vibrio cincinnatiensis]MCG3758844.1 type II toxin-antitoxin system death-on-curing family toxin [Vibrio cincinnatiensis]MCG3762194.1 type II toxin-antitoxin system death-on-curing family toxin [Vibrio cincinnatiensis]
MKSSLLFLDVEDVIEIHDSLLSEGQGLKGVNQDKVEAVIGRVKSNYSYTDNIQTPFDLAAHYAVAIARGHAFNDGNKRTAFVTMITVLKINGIPVPDDMQEQLLENVDSWADLMVGVAEGKVEAKHLANIISLVYLVALAGVGLSKIITYFTNE